MTTDALYIGGTLLIVFALIVLVIVMRGGDR